MTDGARGKPSRTESVRLACIEISRFRRLAAVRVDVDEDTTILVGANNSGKTSILTAIRQFLTERPAFGAYDLSVEQWPTLRELGKRWEALDADPATDTANKDDWQGALEKLLGCMPAIDLWFSCQASGFHYILPFLPSLQWDGGPVGVRLRVEPATSTKELQALAWRYREARQRVRLLDTHRVGQPAPSGAWPMDLVDYWLRSPGDLSQIGVYKLDPAKGPFGPTPTSRPQALPPTAKPLNRGDVARLILVDFVSAQRGLGTEEARDRPFSNPDRIGMFSNQVLGFVRQHLNPAGTTAGDHPDLLRAIIDAQANLDKQIQLALDPTIKEVRALGYPGLHDPQGVHVRTRIQTADLLDHSTAIQYSLDGTSAPAFLPEHAIGLGYQNLQSLSYQLVEFRERRLNPAKGAPAPVHLVILEEPEAHLHVQVQQVFPQHAIKLIRPAAQQYGHLASQLILSTHASHLAHAEAFTRLRYVRRVPSAGGMAGSEVVNLAGVFGSDTATQTFAERYFQVQHTDILFADAAIFVEGTAERMLVPLFIDAETPKLNSRYLSFLDVGGSHAHRLKPLIEKLGIPTVVITDIDPMIHATTSSGEETLKAAPVRDPVSVFCGNDTLKKWHPRLGDATPIAEFSTASRVSTGPNASVYFAWQTPELQTGTWPSSFEDAFILANVGWFKAKSDEAGALGQAGRTVAKCPGIASLHVDLHELLRSRFNKGDFAAAMFERMSAGEKLVCPAYIKDALTWLAGELDETRSGGKP